MRPALRLLARFLEPGAPTGLTGLATHSAPRSTLIYLYSSTLSKLQAIPAHSPYRQALEALTKKRLAAVEAAVPEGLEAWETRVKEVILKHRQGVADKKHLPEEAVTKIALLEKEHQDDLSKLDAEIAKIHEQYDGVEVAQAEGLKHGGKEFVFADFSPLEVEWEAPKGSPNQAQPESQSQGIRLEAEPRLTAEQIGQLENAIGAGLIEEVIQVAEGEHKLVDVMIKNKVWEELTEKAPEGQWAYFERNTHTATQKP